MKQLPNSSMLSLRLVLIIATHYCTIKCEKNNKSSNTRLADDSLLLVVPPISKGISNTFFERSFIYAAPTEWNKLDGRIKKITNLTHLNVK